MTWSRGCSRGPARHLVTALICLLPALAHAETLPFAIESADGTWHNLTPPRGFGEPAGIYDSARRRLVVTGGDLPYYPCDTYAESLSGSAEWSFVATTGFPPNYSTGHSAIFDPVGDRMIVFGGFQRTNGPPTGTNTNGVWALSEATQAWSFISAAGTPPTARSGHSAIYDPVRHRMIVCGGLSTGGSVDVWGLSLSGTPTWTQLSPAGGPTPRYSHTAIYDPVRDRMIVFGGSVSGSPRNDTWELTLSGTPTWTELAPTGSPPSARFDHSAVYDADNDRMVVFGGKNASSYFGDTWVLSLAGTPAWTQLSPSGLLPGARAYHVAVADPAGHRMVISGGYSDVAGYTDSKALSLTGSPTWTTLTPTSAYPYWRYAHSAIYDPDGDRMIVCDGINGSLGVLSELYAVSLSGLPALSSLSASGTAPSARGNHTAIYDPVRKRMLVFGGTTGTDVQALSLSGSPAWSLLPVAGTPPSARSAHTAIYDPVRDQMVVFAGASGGIRQNDVWALSLSGTPTWSQITPQGGPPGARDQHSAIYDPVRDRMLVFGGHDIGGNNLGDIWSLDFAGSPAWTQLSPSGTPPPARSGHVAIYDSVRDRMVVFGGLTNGGSTNDAWAMSLASPGWSLLSPSGVTPSGRYDHAAIYDPLRDRIVTYAGYSSDDLRSLNFTNLHILTASAASSGTISPAGALVVTEGTDLTFTILPNSGYGVADVQVDGVSVGVTGSYTFTNIQGDHTIAATFGVIAAVEPGRSVAELALGPPRPNPSSNGGFDIDFSLPQPGRVRLSVFDVAGREVARPVDEYLTAGKHSVRDRSGALKAGVYWLSLAASGHELARRWAVVR